MRIIDLIRIQENRLALGFEFFQLYAGLAIAHRYCQITTPAIVRQTPIKGIEIGRGLFLNKQDINPFAEVIHAGRFWSDSETAPAARDLLHEYQEEFPVCPLAEFVTPQADENQRLFRFPKEINRLFVDKTLREQTISLPLLTKPAAISAVELLRPVFCGECLLNTVCNQRAGSYTAGHKQLAPYNQMPEIVF